MDSITVASRLCLHWCKGKPQATSDRSGKPDMRSAYGITRPTLSSCRGYVVTSAEVEALTIPEARQI